MSDERRVAGRASSQVSIYDYPEHLNPFYEDDHHKRLRFWKIGSSSRQGQKVGRSNSFTLNGLKDIWAFKSFKLKKKSSTLGINKTSESPPELRRVYPVADAYNTVDSRSRHTIDIGLGNNFERGAGYRSSLQNVHSTGADSNGFYRNDRYRSTIQNGFQTLATTSPQRDRYVYSGSVTPTPRTRVPTPQSRYGSSQTSINSTNPFEDDDTISRCESIDGVSPRKHRKKRKAPQPPVTTPAVSATQQACTTVEENEVSGKEDMGEISNLTAEIETFVRTHDNDQEELREDPEKSPQNKKVTSPPVPSRSTTTQVTVIEKKDVNETNNVTELPSNHQTVDIVTIEQVPIETHVMIAVHNEQKQKTQSSEVEASEIRKESSERTSEQAIEDRKLLMNSRESPENNEDYPERTSQTPDRDHVTRIRKVNSEKQLNVTERDQVIETVVHSPPRIIIRKPTEDWELDEEFMLDDKAKYMENEESPKTPISSEVEFILEQDTSLTSSPSTRKFESQVNKVVSPVDEVQIVSPVKEKQIVSAVKEVQTVSAVKEVQIVSPVNEVQIVSVQDDKPKEKPKISTKKNFKYSLEDSSDVPLENHKHIKQSLSEDTSELKIVESTDDLTDTPPISQNSERYKIRFVALKNFSPESERRDVELRSHNSDEFDVEDADLPPAPPQRRRSVRDIIAAINKSQSLLKINQQPNGNNDTKRCYSIDQIPQQTIPTTINDAKPLQLNSTPSNDSIIRKFNELDESERKIRKMICDMEKSSIDVPIPVVERFDEFNNNHSEDLFKKCVVRRDKSSQSGASQEDNRPSMEWNPLPKPRRSRNLTHEMETGKI